MPTKKSLTKDEILRRRSDIQRVFRSRTGCRMDALRLRCVPNGLEISRAVFAGRRKTKSAVERNRLRRRGRELYRQVKGEIRPGFDIALLVDSADPPFGQQLQDLQAALARLGLVTDKWND